MRELKYALRRWVAVADGESTGDKSLDDNLKYIGLCSAMGYLMPTQASRKGEKTPADAALQQLQFYLRVDFGEDTLDPFTGMVNSMRERKHGLCLGNRRRKAWALRMLGEARTLDKARFQELARAGRYEDLLGAFYFDLNSWIEAAHPVDSPFSKRYATCANADRWVAHFSIALGFDHDPVRNKLENLMENSFEAADLDSMYPFNDVSRGDNTFLWEDSSGELWRNKSRLAWAKQNALKWVKKYLYEQYDDWT